MASHDSGNSISPTRTSANSHSTGLVQSILVFGASAVTAVVMLDTPCHSGAPRRGEPGIHNPGLWLWIPGLRPVAHPGMTTIAGVHRSHPKQFRIASLDFLGHRLHAGRIFLHQLDVGNLAPAGLGLHLRM